MMWGKKGKNLLLLIAPSQATGGVGSSPRALILPYSKQPAQDRPIDCPHCGGKVHKHGTRLRSYKIGDIKKWCRVWRFCCRKCGKTFTRLPWFLIPYKRYIAQEIEGVLYHLYSGGKLTKAPCFAEESTLRRWRKEFSYKIHQWAGLLESGVYKLLCRTTGIIRLSTDPLKRLKKALYRLAPLPSRWALMVKALYWILPSHPLCLSCPPGYGIDWCQNLEKGDDTS